MQHSPFSPFYKLIQPKFPHSAVKTQSFILDIDRVKHVSRSEIKYYESVI